METKGNSNMSGMLEWARHEVELALDREKAYDDDDSGFDYAKGCYESALKAFASICEDGHSGMSIALTMDVLNRLLSGRPLTTVEDKPEEWQEAWKSNDGVLHYQHKRLSSLFKDLFPDGKVIYQDVSAYECADEGDGIPYHAGGSGEIFNKYFPVTFPYYPPSKRYRILTRTVLSDPKNGDFDTRAYLKIIAPDGTETVVNRYFGQTKNGWDEIDCYEFFNRQMMEKERKKKEEENQNGSV